MRCKSWRYRKHTERAYITPRSCAPRVERENEKKFYGISVLLSYLAGASRSRRSRSRRAHGTHWNMGCCVHIWQVCGGMSDKRLRDEKESKKERKRKTVKETHMTWALIRERRRFGVRARDRRRHRRHQHQHHHHHHYYGRCRDL